MMNKALDTFGDLGDDEELGPSDWPTVKRYLPCLDNLELERVHSQAVPQSEKKLDAMNISSVRIHLLNGDNEIAYLVINESKAEEKEARKFLEDTRLVFPQVLRILKTRQMAYSILKQLSDYLQNLEKFGLSEENEIIHLQEAIQTNLKKLLRKPTFVKMPELTDLLRGHPFFGALPPMVREPLEDSTHEIMELEGKAIYREGSNPIGIWLISNGLVKWTSMSLKDNHSLHPIFSYGVSLGLYEVLVGKPYICNMITDSAVQCFFIGAEEILSLLRSDPAVEIFLLQESAIVIAKLLFPQVYEKMSMQELRALIVERSTMKIYTREETIEMPNRSVGFLLEGVVKPQEVQEELIPSPAVLLPVCVNLSFFNLETSGANGASFYNQRSGYLVETTARIVVFNMEAVEGDGVGWKQSSHSVDITRGQNREYCAQLNWSKHFYVPTRSGTNSDETDQHTNSLAARALQLSVFGSMVNDIPRSSE